MKINVFLSELTYTQKKEVLFLGLAAFFILLTYPYTRITTTVMFMESFGSKLAPTAWFVGVFCLSLTILFINYLHHRWGPQKIFTFLVFFSLLIFLLGPYLYHLGFRWMAFPLFVWKEVYIVLLVHLYGAYINNYFSLEGLKLMLGPLGALGSLGGVVGGQIISLSAGAGELFIWLQSSLVFILSWLCFSRLPLLEKTDSRLAEVKPSPLKSIGEIKKYVAAIVGLIALTQFCLSIAEFQFNMGLEKAFVEKVLRTEKLARLYSLTNFIALLIQIIIMPLIMTKISIRRIHFSIPIFYLLLAVSGYLVGGLFFISMAMMFIGFKSVDYSLFSAAKDILFHPMSSAQKYGAKYLSDMISYRSSKALIAVLLIFYQDAQMLFFLLIFFLVAWCILVIFLYRIQKELINLGYLRGQ